MYSKLLEQAETAREKSYSPYSKFKVGAALLAAEGKVYTGCNVECASYSMTCCAERTAFFKAVSEGEKDFAAIAIVGGYDNTAKACIPCGACLQVMAEFCRPDFKVILKNNGGIKIYTLSDFLPESFVL